MTGSDTIYAVSSGAGKSAVAVIRISGPQAGPAVIALAGALPKARHAHLTDLRDSKTGEVYDQGLVIWFPAPHSATGEDVAEFHVHGSRAVVEALFAAFAVLPAIRMAEPGEFVRRAFAAGKLDLLEVEGLADLLNAETAVQRRLALRQASGAATSAFENWRSQLLGVIAHVEALIDFADESDTSSLRIEGERTAIAQLAADMKVEVVRAGLSRGLRQGFKVVLAGLPNTGKSSLLNSLARRDAAIVSPQAGTTRDVIEVPMEIEGLLVTLTDTAGLRGSGDAIEMIGVGRAHREMAAADMVLWVWSVDVEGSATPADGIKPDIMVLNKADLPQSQTILIRNDSDPTCMAVSSITGEGLAALLGRVGQALLQKNGATDMALITRQRQVEAVEQSIRYLNDALARAEGQLELLAEDLRGAASALARLVGRIDVEDLLAAIFAEFCIGK